MPKTNSKKRITNRKEPRITLVKTISDFCGNDKRVLMFKKVKGKLFLFIVDSKKEGKIPLKEEPKAYSSNEFENLGVFLYKLIQEEKKK